MSDYTDKLLASASWITQDLLAPVLRKISKKDVTIQNMNITPAVAVGENYGSVMYRVALDYTTSASKDVESCRLLVKAPPTNDFMSKMTENFGIFSKEMAMYKNCIPTMMRLQKQYFPGDINMFPPESYSCRLDNVIIMEDLTSAGYKMAKRQSQLDYDHVCKTFKSLARFHALSLKMLETKQNWFQIVSREVFDADDNNFAQMFDQMLPAFGQCVTKWSGDEKYCQLLDSLTKNCYIKLCETMKPKPGRFRVLCHGDMWVNNMLFKYDEHGSVTHCKLIDYQLGRYSSPALDLVYFLFTSVQTDLLCTRMYDMVRQYYNYLQQDLKQLKLDKQHHMTFQQLKQDMESHCYLTIVQSATMLPMIVSAPEQAFNPEDMDPSMLQDIAASPMAKLYESTIYQQKAVKVIQFLFDIGYLQSADNNTKHLN